ncbi:MAG: hypothetical protein EI684_19320 [Candidatus Viridilinea halotolerans]|uniref:Uncharacterized protein n=1 Tax=Candidatus Viridilinea halotolerans TaxID=2491704 RepID=A0A426TSU5_9CHLR|nr:MAG: hypothetical protein EI684_19320 [Candidatus Viridilinea halotolerans]
MPHRLTALKRLLALMLLSTLLLVALPARAQSDTRYFPETDQTLGGLFRLFWELNGATANFGYPITAEYQLPDGRTVQWFERARFELVGSGDQWRVELGNLGTEFTQGRVFPKVPPIEDSADFRYIPQTQHIIKFGFKEIWETRGAERIFGYPISEEIQEVLEDGQWHTVQYFEKARFEYWPELPPGQRVLISNLGRRLAPGGPPPPPPSPPPASTPASPLGEMIHDQLPAQGDVFIIPIAAPPDTAFYLYGAGFDPNEPIDAWLTNAQNESIPLDLALLEREADVASIAFATTDMPEGDYTAVLQGRTTQVIAAANFRLTRAYIAGPGTPRPANMNGDATPADVNPNMQVRVAGYGLRPNELVEQWITEPDGGYVLMPFGDQADALGQIGVTTEKIFWTPEDALAGVYGVHMRGLESGARVSVYFSVWR